jgi:hypothetical protein
MTGKNIFQQIRNPHTTLTTTRPSAFNYKFFFETWFAEFFNGRINATQN